jgi:hypothetical protein
MSSDEQSEPREDEEIEAHRYVTDEPSEDDLGKTKTRTRSPEETGGDEFEKRTRY